MGIKHAGVAKLVDARDLSRLSALRETEGAELPKFGETGNRQSRAKRTNRKADCEGVETRRAAPNGANAPTVKV